jgi:DNA-binding CsgD family transcriptional regulator
MTLLKALTAREKEILKLIGQGKSSKQIADQLNLSVLTIGNHRKQICKKLGLHSTAEVVSYAAKLQALQQSGATPCAVAFNFKNGKTRVKLTYEGYLSNSPVAATVRIGEKTYHF